MVDILLSIVEFKIRASEEALELPPKRITFVITGSLSIANDFSTINNFDFVQQRLSLVSSE